MTGDILTGEPGEELDPLRDALISLLFASLSRRDQRGWARVYLQGLLAATGKKTIRNIAGASSGSAEQSLQQFISKSPWDWMPVRRALARYIETNAERPLAWIVHPMIIEKAGDRSVGVGRQFVPELGRTANCQQAGGVWLASGQAAFPVEWSLTLPRPWTTELSRRRAGIPETARSRTPVQDAIHSVLRMANDWQLRRRPVVMEGGEVDLQVIVDAFTRNDIPFVLKVSGSTLVRPARGGRYQHTYTATAHEVIDAQRSQRRLMEFTGHDGKRSTVVPLASSVVHSAQCEDHPGGASPALLLLGAWPGASTPWPTEFWLTNIDDRPISQHFLLARLTRRVAVDFADVCEPVGIRDFEGRSFRGWHHHVTLASVAHAVRLLSAPGVGVIPEARSAVPSGAVSHHTVPLTLTTGLDDDGTHRPGRNHLYS